MKQKQSEQQLRSRVHLCIRIKSLIPCSSIQPFPRQESSPMENKEYTLTSDVNTCNRMVLHAVIFCTLNKHREGQSCCLQNTSIFKGRHQLCRHRSTQFCQFLKILAFLHKNTCKCLTKCTPLNSMAIVDHNSWKKEP